MLLRYAAGSTAGSGGFGSGICGSEPKLEDGSFAERGDCMLSLLTEGVFSREAEDFEPCFRLKRPILVQHEEPRQAGDGCRERLK